LELAEAHVLGFHSLSLSANKLFDDWREPQINQQIPTSTTNTSRRKLSNRDSRFQQRKPTASTVFNKAFRSTNYKYSHGTTIIAARSGLAPSA
jgi:hypothetical protein